jgi:hypothetical protein
MILNGHNPTTREPRAIVVPANVVRTPDQILTRTSTTHAPRASAITPRRAAWSHDRLFLAGLITGSLLLAAAIAVLVIG